MPIEIHGLRPGESLGKLIIRELRKVQVIHPNAGRFIHTPLVNQPRGTKRREARSGTECAIPRWLQRFLLDGNHLLLLGPMVFWIGTLRITLRA